MSLVLGKKLQKPLEFSGSVFDMLMRCFPGEVDEMVSRPRLVARKASFVIREVGLSDLTADLQAANGA